MSRHAPTPGQLRRLGALVLLSVLGLGFVAIRLPRWLAAPTTPYAVAIPVVDGADGLAAGSPVFLGGIQLGEVEGISESRESADGRFRAEDLITIRFALDSSVELSRDAVIRRTVGVSGSDAALEISDPGSPKRRFSGDDERVVPITTDSSPGGPGSGVIGRTNGESIQRLSENLSSAAPGIALEVRELGAAIARLVGDFDSFEALLQTDSGALRRRLDAVIGRLRRVFEGIAPLQAAWLEAREEAERETEAVRSEIDGWTRRIEATTSNLDLARVDLDFMQRRLVELEPKLAGVRLDVRSALEDAESVRVRLQQLGPEASEGLARTMARLVLAGGQLKRATDDLLPLAIEAVLTRPNRASASRRLLLEAGNDAVEAGLQLRDAARRLEMLDRLRPLLDPDATMPPIPDLDGATDRLSDTLDRLAERIREVIEQEL
ncbi:MAG: hypothetical protein VX012_10320 [Planctomycetota bacterium]|nr:hypothetical protein [Planctomycetota bacterium]